MKVYEKEISEDDAVNGNDSDGGLEALRSSLNSSSHSCHSQELATSLWDDVPSTSAPLKDVIKKRNKDTAGSVTLAGTASVSSKSHRGSSTTWAGSSAADTNNSNNNNIWTRLLRSEESVWDSLNVHDNEYDDDDADDDELVPQEIFYNEKENNKDKPYNRLSILRLTLWYELRHFFKTLCDHPHIILTSLLVFAFVAGIGGWAITSERDAYVATKKSTAEFVARETATYFSNEFKRAFVPLYSLREAVLHSGDYDHLATKIGRYPNLVNASDSVDVEVPGGLANLRDVKGICDDEEVLQKWEDLLDASTAENDLDGLIFRYRLSPKNVFCLEYKMGKANMDSGMDASNSAHPFWTMVVQDLFIHRWKGLHVFGPFMAGAREVFCTHLAIWDGDDFNNRNWIEGDSGALNLNNVVDDHLNIHGTEVNNVWGFVMNYLDWGELKRRSDIHGRFANVDMDFYLTRRTEDIDPELSGPKGEPTKQFAHLASSEDSHLLDDGNSIVVETETLHGLWTNRVGITSANGWNPDWWGAAVASVVMISVLLASLTASTLVKSQLHRNLVESMIPKKAIKKLHRNQTVIEKFNLVTVFYADVVDFSSGAGKSNMTSSVQVMKMMNDLFTELDTIAKRHGVYKVETVGQRYMVVGGAPEQESARVAAKRVALFALDAMSFVDSIFRTKEGDKLVLRAGIGSGPAVAGCIGKAVPRYCFFGDAVDAASEMESTAEKRKVQCSEITYRLLQDSNMTFVMTKRSAGKDLKGMDDDHNTYWIEKASPCEKCFSLTRGSWVLHPCGHVLCAGCNHKHDLNVCPTCRCKVDDRIEWKGKTLGCGGDEEKGGSDNGSVIFEDQ